MYFPFLYKYSYFQKSCTKINNNDNTIDIMVLVVIGSDLNMCVSMLNMNIPAVNDMNRPGQKVPPKPVTADSVAYMNIMVIGMPIIMSAQRNSRAHDHNSGPFNCSQTSTWPSIKRKNANTICL